MRKARQVLPGFPHHVILRGNNRRCLFTYPRDYEHFIRLVEISTRLHDVALHHLCLMRNHVHFLVTPGDELVLAAWVKYFSQRYAQRRNKARGATGKLFEERFRSFPITDDNYLITCSAYIELNPLRAGAVRDLADYRWSTYRLLTGDEPRSAFSFSAWTPTYFYRSFGHSAGERAGEFKRWIAERCGDPSVALSEGHARVVAAAEALSAGKPERLVRPDGSRCH